MNVKIENLVGKLDLHFVGHTKIDKEALTEAINESFREAIIGLSQGINEINSPKGNDRYIQAILGLKSLIEKAELAISAIENNKPCWEICQLAVEDINELTEQIGNAITGGYLHKLREKDKELMKERLQLDGEIQKVPPRSPHKP